MTDSSPKFQLPSEVNGSVSELAESSSGTALWQIANDFRAWVIRDLRALTDTERAGFRGDYLFIIDGSPLFWLLSLLKQCLRPDGMPDKHPRWSALFGR